MNGAIVTGESAEERQQQMFTACRGHTIARTENEFSGGKTPAACRSAEAGVRLVAAGRGIRLRIGKG